MQNERHFNELEDLRNSEDRLKRELRFAIDEAKQKIFRNNCKDKFTYTLAIVKVQLKQSKTDDPFRKGVSIFLGRTQADLCPVSAILA